MRGTQALAQSHKREGIFGNAHANMHVLVGKVGNNEHLFLAGGTQESVLAVGVVAIVGNVVGILQVVERALAERGFAVAEFYYIIIICVQGLLLGRAR